MLERDASWLRFITSEVSCQPEALIPGDQR